MLTHVTADTPFDEVQLILEQDGACIVDALLDSPRVDAIMSDLGPHIDATPWNNVESEGGKFRSMDREFFGMQTKRLHGLVGLSAQMEAVLLSPFLLGLAEAELGRRERCRDLRVSTIELMVLGQGQGNQALHRDLDAWPYVERSREKPMLFSANIALTDFTEDNGATVVVPGSHRWEEGRTASPDETCLALMSRGSALLYSGDVIHGGGANVTPRERIGCYLGYIPSWLRGLENHVVSAGESAVAGCSERARQLLDYLPGGFIVIP